MQKNNLKYNLAKTLHTQCNVVDISVEEIYNALQNIDINQQLSSEIATHLIENLSLNHNANYGPLTEIIENFKIKNLCTATY